MVHKVPTARIRFDKGFWGTSGKLVLTLGKKDYLLRKVARAEYDHLLSRQLEQPKVLARVKGKNYWLFKNNIYSDLDDLKASQIYAVLEASRMRRQRKVENAVALQDLKHQPAVRRGIPDEVKYSSCKETEASAAIAAPPPSFNTTTSSPSRAVEAATQKISRSSAGRATGQKAPTSPYDGSTKATLARNN